MKMKNTNAVGKNVVLASISAVGIIMVLGAILGSLVMNETLMIERAHIIMTIVTIMSVFAASWVVALRVQKKKLVLSGAVCGACIILLLILRSVLFARSQIAFDYRLILTMSVFIPAGFLASRKKARKR